MILQKLSSIQELLKAPKSHHNNFGNYDYRNCEDIQNAVKPLLKQLNAALALSDEIVEIGGWHYVKATATFTDIDSEKNVEVTAYAREEEVKTGMDQAQITGAASSYARKYALNGMFLIDDANDPDATNNGKEDAKTTTAPKKPYTASAKNYEIVGEAVKWNGTTWKRIKGIGKDSKKPYDLFLDQNKDTKKKQKPIDPAQMEKNLATKETAPDNSKDVEKVLLDDDTMKAIEKGV